MSKFKNLNNKPEHDHNEIKKTVPDIYKAPVNLIGY